MSSEGPTTGFYGKLPALGDFVGRRLPRDFVTPWDDWLQLSMAASRNQLGDAWLETYLTSPLWRFVLSPGVCGGAACAGVLMPSVDRVGRYFPLVLAVALPEGSSLPHVAGATDWFGDAETLLLSTLDDELEFELDGFDERVAALGPPPLAPAPLSESSGVQDTPLRVPLSDGGDVTGCWQTLVDRLAHRHLGPYSLWWTAGSEQVEPSLLLCDALPAPECYAAMLDGAWSGGEADLAPQSAVATSSAGAPLILDAGFPEEPV